MKLTPAHKWIKEQFEGGVTPKRVRLWVEKGVIPGNIIDGAVFVDADRAAVMLDTHTVIENQQPAPQEASNAKIASIMQAAMTG